jgi:formylglycine-generating enzyme required for sulfatase activity
MWVYSLGRFLDLWHSMGFLRVTINIWRTDIMSNQKNSAISQIVSSTFSPSSTDISHQFHLPALFHIRPAFTRYFTVRSNKKVINGLLILLLLASLSLITACNSNKDSVFSNDSNDSSSSSGDSNSGSGGSSDDSDGSSGSSDDSSGGSDGENTPFVDSIFDGIEFIAIKHGCFVMGNNDGQGDEKPAHEVCISRDFYLSKTEITQKQWKAAGMIPLEDNDPAIAHIYDDDKPVVNGAIFLDHDTVSVFAEFIGKLSKKTGGHYRLPTEAEWEYAARAGTTTKYFFGDSTGRNDEVLKEYAWFRSNSDKKLHKVATRKPNPWGLYDMYGNVFELTQDYYDADYYQQRIKNDPVNREQIKSSDIFLGRIVRGGNYQEQYNGRDCTAEYLGSTTRFVIFPSHDYSFGFRLVRER